MKLLFSGNSFIYLHVSTVLAIISHSFLYLFQNFKLIYDDWRGYLIAFFALVWIANFYMTFFGILRQMLKVEKLEANLKDNEWHEVKEEIKQNKDTKK